MRPLDRGAWTVESARMTCSKTSGAGVVVIALNGQGVEAELRTMANDSGMLVIEAPGAKQAYVNIIRQRPEAIILQVSRMLSEAIKLVQLVAGSPNPVPVIAVASHHGVDVERAMRIAGATCYVPEIDVDEVRQALSAVLA